MVTPAVCREAAFMPRQGGHSAVGRSAASTVDSRCDRENQPQKNKILFITNILAEILKHEAEFWQITKIVTLAIIGVD